MQGILVAVVWAVTTVVGLWCCVTACRLDPDLGHAWPTFAVFLAVNAIAMVHAIVGY